MLSAATLSDELRAFHDSRFAGFVGFPTHRDPARDRWAAAFATYIADLVCLDPLLVPGRGALKAGSLAAFRGPLTLAETIRAPAKAAEFAAAWQAAILSIRLLGTPTTYSGAPVSAIIWFPPSDIAGRHSALLAQLTALFETPAIETTARLDEIANAFHTATLGLLAQAALPLGVTQVLSYG